MEYRDNKGNIWTFFDFDGDAYGAQGQLWKVQNADGGPGARCPTPGHQTDITHALDDFEASGGHPTARCTKVYDSAGREYDITYGGTGSRMSLVVAKVGSTEAARVAYDTTRARRAGEAWRATSSVSP